MSFVPSDTVYNLQAGVPVELPTGPPSAQSEQLINLDATETIYYGTDNQVGPNHNIGSIAPGASVILASNTPWWVVGTGPVQMDVLLISNVQVGGVNIFGGSGPPPTGLGMSGDVYLRNDTPGTVNQRLYINNAGVWTGIL